MVLDINRQSVRPYCLTTLYQPSSSCTGLLLEQVMCYGLQAIEDKRKACKDNEVEAFAEGKQLEGVLQVNMIRFDHELIVGEIHKMLQTLPDHSRCRCGSGFGASAQEGGCSSSCMATRK